MLRTINNLVQTLLIQAHMPHQYWAEALSTASYLLNILPSSAISNQISFTKLFNVPARYSHLRTFGCLCYPNLSATTAHKLEPRSTPCVFLGYPNNHRGYRCLDISTRKVILSRHVIFDESTFPFSSISKSLDLATPSLELLPSPSPILRDSTPPAPVSSTSDAAPPPPPPDMRHHMVTRAKSGIIKPRNPLCLHIDIVSPLPTSHVQAAQDPSWNPSMAEEYNALIKAGTWTLVPRPVATNIIRSLWNFRHKFNGDGKLTRHKSRLVANGKSQQPGIDCDKTFSPIVKPTTIRAFLHVAINKDWPIRQLDIKNAFLHGTLDETVYMHQPPGFVDKTKPDHVCLLKRSLYV
ncbi:unnamed protein product [Microthlaspi erraticum]|uniref:Uncharacterized protein n=1 Tax=Microthlaspi erraticum TaxID=1685480 RepID=A0A6D2IFJ1_9BRAS|nr:unnamed protein product [Microthlaspi erraticum]